MTYEQFLLLKKEVDSNSQQIDLIKKTLEKQVKCIEVLFEVNKKRDNQVLEQFVTLHKEVKELRKLITNNKKPDSSI